MEQIIFNSSEGNRYLYLNNSIIFLPPTFYQAVSESTKGINDINSLYFKKYAFLKKHISNKGEISFKTSLTPQRIKMNIANLRQLIIEVTDSCNLSCKYCGYGSLYNNHDDRNGKKQPFRQVRILLDYLLDMWRSSDNGSYKNDVFISFYGGEPLLNFELIKQTIEYIENLKLYNINFRYNMTTNAMLLDRYMDYLQEKQIRVLISLDGDEYNHSYRTTRQGKNSFQQVLSNILKLRNKYPNYYQESVNFNAVLHNRNSIEEINNFILQTLGKVLRIEKKKKIGIAKDKVEEFNNMFQVKYDNDNDNEYIVLDEERDVEYMLNDMKVSLFNQFIDSFMGRLDLLDLFSNKEKISQYYPTGTCLPFQKKLFLTVNGKILPCERVGQLCPLGFVDSNGVTIDYDYISNLYSELYAKMAGKCKDCYNWESCGQCVYLLKANNDKIDCKIRMPMNKISSYLSKNITTAERYPFLYKKLVNELVSD